MKNSKENKNDKSLQYVTFLFHEDGTVAQHIHAKDTTNSVIALF